MDEMPIKTSKKIATESFNSVDGRFLLLGTDILISQFGPKSEFLTFYDVFGLGCRFYYLAQHTCNRDRNTSEIGIGFLQKYRKNFFIKRTKKILQTVNGNYINPEQSEYCHFQNIRGNDCLTVSSYIPTTINHILSDPNSLIYSSDSGIPCPIQLHDNSLLVCIGGQIQSLTFKEFAKKLKDHI